MDDQSKSIKEIFDHEARRKSKQLRTSVDGLDPTTQKHIWKDVTRINKKCIFYGMSHHEAGSSTSSYWSTCASQYVDPNVETLSHKVDALSHEMQQIQDMLHSLGGRTPFPRPSVVLKAAISG